MKHQYNHGINAIQLLIQYTITIINSQFVTDTYCSSVLSELPKVIRQGTISRIRFIDVHIFKLIKFFRSCLTFKLFLEFGPECADSFRNFILSNAFQLSPTSLAFLKHWNWKKGNVNDILRLPKTDAVCDVMHFYFLWWKALKLRCFCFQYWILLFLLI